MWEWSHSPEAYDTARANVQAKDREWLEVVFAEWHASPAPKLQENKNRGSKYNIALAKAKKLSEDALADFIWDKMSKQRVCSEGGHNAYCCPYYCHTVPFSPVEEKVNA